MAEFDGVSNYRNSLVPTTSAPGQTLRDTWVLRAFNSQGYPNLISCCEIIAKIMDPRPPGMFQLETWESMWFAIPAGMDDADELVDIIKGGGGTIVDETRATQAQYLLLSATLNDLRELSTQATANGALAIDARWIYASKIANKLLPWYKYQIRKPETTKNMDVNMRDLRELSIHLARYNPVGPVPDEVYLRLARKLPHHTAKQLKQLHELHCETVDACVVELANKMAAIAPPVDYDFFKRVGTNTPQARSQSTRPANPTYPLSPSSDSEFPRPPFPFSTREHTSGGGKMISSTTISAATMSAASPLYHRRTTSRRRQVDIGEPQDDDEDGGDGTFPTRVGGARRDKGKQRADPTNFVNRPISITQPTLDNAQSFTATSRQAKMEAGVSTAGMPTTSAPSSSVAPKEEDTESVLPPAANTGTGFPPVPLAVNENEIPRRRSERGRKVGRARWVWAEVEKGTDWIWVEDLGEGISISDSQYL